MLIAIIISVAINILAARIIWNLHNIRTANRVSVAHLSQVNAGLQHFVEEDLRIIENLKWERDAAHFMLETVLNEMPAEHPLTRKNKPARMPTVKMALDSTAFVKGIQTAKDVLDQFPTQREEQ